MNLKSKQRVIGALVLLAILAIFVPILFYNTKFAKQSMKLNPNIVPPKPPKIDLSLQSQSTQKITHEKKSARMALPKNTAQNSSSFAQQGISSTPVIPENKTKTNTPLAVGASSTPTAWVVQIASFSKQENANKLIKNLQKANFDAYTRTTVKNGNKLTQIFVGPEISYQKTQQIKSQLFKLFKLTGVIRRYQL